MSVSNDSEDGEDSDEEEGEERSDKEFNSFLLAVTQWKAGRPTLTPNIAHHVPPLRTKITFSGLRYVMRTLLCS